MKNFALVLSVFTFGLIFSTSIGANSNEESFDDSVIAAIEYPDWFKASLLDFPEDLKEARVSGKKGIMIVFGTQGCSYCKALVDRVLSDTDMQRLIRRHFDVIALEIFSDVEMIDPSEAPMRVKSFAKQEQAEFSPTVLFYDLNGNRVFRVVGYYPRERFRKALDYVIDEAYRIHSFSNYVNNRDYGPQIPNDNGMSVQKSSIQLTPARHRQDTGPLKPKLVIFERSGCDACTRFQEEVLSDEEIRKTLEQFLVQRVDINSVKPVAHPGNRSIHASSWASALGFSRVPALAFYDNSDEVVLKTDAEVRRQRMENALGYVLTGAYAQGITYQRYARNRAAEKLRRSMQQN